MENSFVRMVNEIKNLSEAVKYKNFDGSIRMKWNNLLNELTSLDFNVMTVWDPEPPKILIRAMTTIPAEEDMLIVKSSFILSSIGKKQKIQLSEMDVKASLEWLLNAIRINRCVGLCDILRAVEVILKSIDNDIPQISDDLVACDQGILMVLLTNPAKLQDKSMNYENCLPSEILLSTVSCLKTLLNSPIKIVEPVLNAIMTEIHKLIFKNGAAKFSEANYCTLMANALNICRHICVRDRDICFSFIGENMGAAKAFMMFGLSDVDHSVNPQKLNISQQTIEPDMFYEEKGGKVPKTRKPAIMRRERRRGNKTKKSSMPDESKDFKVSDNEFNGYTTTSDSDSTDPSRHKQSAESKLRLNALSLIGVIGRLVDTKSLFGYWHSFFPSDVATPSTVSLLNAAVRDPDPRCRIAALQAATIILHGSKPFLSQAEQNDKPHPSYIPFSITLGDMIVSMYASLNRSLSTEGSLPVLIQVLKCMASLVQATPFNRMNRGLITKLMEFLRRLVYHKDPSIVSNALIVTSLIIRHNEITKELSDCIGAPHIPSKKPKRLQEPIRVECAEIEDEEIDEFDFQEEKRESDDSVVGTQSVDINAEPELSWLLQVVLNNLGVTLNDSPPNSAVQSVRIESLQMISTLATHFQLVKHCLNEISVAINNSFDSDGFEIRMSAVKCLDVVGYWINVHLINEPVTIKNDIEVCLSFWTAVMPKVFQIQHNDDGAALKSVCCDALSNIGRHIFERLEHKKQMALISLLSGCTFDEKLVVQAAAVRALAIYIMFPSLRVNGCFVENTSDAVIRTLQQEGLDIQMRGSWALANITDALVENGTDKNEEIVSNDLMKRLFDVSLACKHNDKVRCNGVRAIGNLLRLLTLEHLKLEHWSRLALRSMQELNHNMCQRSAKLNWNACRAVGNFMRNPAMYSPVVNLKWQDDAVKALCQVVVHNTNFKVRINAASALAVPTDEVFLQSYLAYIWSSLLEALARSDEINDFNEYQHRDHLQEELCVTLAHYIRVAKIEQLIVMEKDVLRFDSTKRNWSRVINRMIPEKATSLITAAMRLQNLLTEAVKHDQHKALTTLSSTFESLLN